jgi:hypothetical protein
MKKPANKPLGSLALKIQLGLEVPDPYTHSYLGTKRQTRLGVYTEEVYPAGYANDSVIGHLRWSLSYEPLDLGVLVTALKAITQKDLEAWIAAEPLGIYARKAWFLYEYFIGPLNLPSLKSGNSVPLLDPKKHFVAAGVPSPRHRIINNLLGGPKLCPTVRRTAKLEAAIAQNYDQKARGLLDNYSPELVLKAARYLYTKETKSSFIIEHENPKGNRVERFMQVLANPNVSLDKVGLISLQQKIVEPRYAAQDWRATQVFVGTSLLSGEQVDFIAPKPSDVEQLMQGWLELSPGLPAVIGASVASFAFVFIHPFEDGNGRIHRFILHHHLAKAGFAPVVFPISAAILRDPSGYDQALEQFSRPRLALMDWSLSEGQVQVQSNSYPLYQFFDATPQTEYLYDKIADTLTQDLVPELAYLARHQKLRQALAEVVDMPERKADLFIRYLEQNAGKLSGNKRSQFAELSDQEIQALEELFTLV